jgi:hypothetical protein
MIVRAKGPVFFVSSCPALCTINDKYPRAGHSRGTTEVCTPIVTLKDLNLETYMRRWFAPLLRYPGVQVSALGK